MEFDIKKDEAKRRLYLRLKGLFSDEDITKAADQTIDAMRGFKGKHFTVVTDISEFKPLTAQGIQQVKRVSVEGLKIGLAATARVVGASAVAKMQFERVSHEGGYPAYTTTSLADADAALDKHRA